MKKKSSSANAIENLNKVCGTVLDQRLQPMANISVRAFNKTMRGRQLLGESVTGTSGIYTINYTGEQDNPADIFIVTSSDKDVILDESELYLNVPASLEVNITLNSIATDEVSAYESLLNTVAAFTKDVPLQELTETQQHRDISFITQKTGLPQNDIENLAMAARFQTFSSIAAYIWYGILSKEPAGNARAAAMNFSAPADFETRLNNVFDALMHTNTALLMERLQQSINENIIAFPVTAELDKIKEQLSKQAIAYAEKHPVSGAASPLYQKAQLAGLEESELQSFVQARNSHNGNDESFFQQVQTQPQLLAGGNIDKVQAVFELSVLTGDNLQLTGKLVASGTINAVADIKKLAAYDQHDWAALLKEHTIVPSAASVTGNSEDDAIQQYAGQLESTFTKKFPTASFAARFQKDTASPLQDRDKINKFLQDNEHFDLLNDQVGRFIKENESTVAKEDAPALAGQLRRLQRVFKLSPDYSTTSLLLNDNIHSSHQVYKMGEDNFVNAYSDKLGAENAKQVFDKASNVHATAIALAGNLKSLADASALNAFPNYSQALTQTLTQELPNLETLFGHTDFCDCDECNSVYGAPAYLTDILHFLDQRKSTLTAVDGKVPSVKDLLLRRRPDLADIDLECNNSNTEVPYIDIACEIMEDYIAAPVITIANTFFPKLVKGTIDAALLAELTKQLAAAGQTAFVSLLTADATVSDVYSIKRLLPDNTYITLSNWMIRGQQVTMRASIIPGTNNVIECRLLHQTLLPSAAISAGPEYINPNVYNNFLKTAKRPFTLPFDLFGKETELYIEKLGFKKVDLIKTFRAKNPSAALSVSDLSLAYASLGLNEAEQSLIFVSDPTHQPLYWATAATGPITINAFEKLTGLNYQQVLDLLGCSFIALPIIHDDLSADTTKQHIEPTAAQLDSIHRFIRLWRKTSFSMAELNAVIMSAYGKSKIDTNLAWQLYQYNLLRQALQLDIYQLISFYQNLDAGSYNELFQNTAVTNPLDPDFAYKNVVAGTTGILEKHKAVIAAVLGITVADVNLLFPKTVARISITSLSFLNRYTKLSLTLGIPVADLLTLLNLIDANPFLSPLSTFQFIQKYQLLQSSGFSIDELNYVLRHQDDSSHSLVPSNSQAVADLGRLQDELLAVRTATQSAADPHGAILNKWLTDPVFKWDGGLLNKLTDILGTIDDTAYQQKIDNNSNFLLNLRMQYANSALTADLAALPLTVTIPAVVVTFPASIAAQLSYNEDKKQLVLAGYMSQADLTALKALSTDAAYQAAIVSLYNAAQQTDSGTGNIFFTAVADVATPLKGLLSAKIADRFAFFINKLSPVYRRLKQQDILLKDISAWFNVDKATVSQLLVTVPGIYADFTDDNFVNKIAAVNNPAQLNRYLFAAKTCFIINRLKLSGNDIAFLFTHAADTGSLNFTDLPLVPQAASATTFGGFEALINLLKFQQYYPAKQLSNGADIISIYKIIQDAITMAASPATTTSLISSLVLLTGWNTADLSALISIPNSLALVLPADLKSPAILLRLHKCFAVLRQFAVPAIDIISWCKPSPTFADASKIKQTLKSKYNDADWLEVTTPLQNTLREQKRDALIAYLLNNPGTQSWKTDNDLYSYFLLDVEMCSCQPTSRIVEATNAVQLFVQRSFLTLEPSINVNTKKDSSWLQWQWMKNFRVWQANIKVFLYPENWIEPELLPDEIKSPFLKDLENELLQNEVTAPNIEDAFANYLQKLNGVDLLEIKGMWYDQPSKTLHVFGRTYGGDPKTYYYRKFIQNRRWTPWVRIDLDINSDYIVPVVYNNRVYLFWATIKEEADVSDTITIPNTTQPQYTMEQPDKNWVIQMAFSEYKNGNWTSKKMAGDDSGQLTARQKDYPDKSAFVFTVFDVPAIDYGQIFDDNGEHIDTAEVFNKKAAAAIRQNGKLVIGCYYYAFKGTYSSINFTSIGAFKLDPVKGYPTSINIRYDIDILQANSSPERAHRDSTFVNMLDTESYSGPNSVRPPGNGIPGSNYRGFLLVSDEGGGGAFANLLPTQMTVKQRSQYIERIYADGFVNDTNARNPSGPFYRIPVYFYQTLPYFYQDQKRCYFVRWEYSDNKSYEYLYSDIGDLEIVRLEQGNAAYNAILSPILSTPGISYMSRYFNFHHPLVDYFVRSVFMNGIDGLLNRDTQLKGDIAYDSSPGQFNFQAYFNPVLDGWAAIYNRSKLPVTYPNGVTDANPGYPKDDVDFSLETGYGLYNWELFFHAPLMIAERLSQNQQFEDADRWYKYIFNPMDTSDYPSPGKYWITKPFFIASSQTYINERIENILKGINTGDQELIKDVSDWRNNPFQPHYIAQYRTVAYQKAAVMKYVGHLIRHGDYLFQQHTIEAANEATQLYILAAEILGPKPEVVPSVGKTAVDNYYQVEQKLDAFSNAMVDIENLVPLQVVTGYNGVKPVTQGLPNLQTMYFCIPMNENLAGPTGYWDVVADRLFKIRHCLDIDGNLAPLALFSAPVDPGMLVRASAAGLDIGNILNDSNAPLPLYRFMIMIQKANELINEVKSLGAALLSVLEKKDAEAMALLRSGHEIRMLNAVISIKQKQIAEAQSTIDNLQKQKELIHIRQEYYGRLISKGLSSNEKQALTLNNVAVIMEEVIAAGHILTGALTIIPNFTVGISGLGSPVATASEGGMALAKAAESSVEMLASIATAADKSASMMVTQASYERRNDEWVYQLNLAQKEAQQIDVQVQAAQIRLEIAAKDLANQQLQISQAQEANDFMRSKFTNQELFSWMITQISATYFQSYQLAYDIAKQTERCFRYELGLNDSAYINFGYWDNLKKGLLTGEKLSYDLHIMETAYMELNRREHELTKHISLSQLDPVALLKLKSAGECWVNLPEELFDMDYPGHYMRRIKSVSLTIPCITGPYTTVSCILTMNNNSMRTSGIAAADAAQYSRKLANGFPTDDPRFRDAVGALQSIATSGAQNDSGLFELNFRDERYLPFEGAGAISLWHLQLPAAVRQFDYNTISDVIIHLKYTARDGGEALRANAGTNLTARINQMLVSTKDKGLARIFSAKNDLATEWYRFLHPANATDDQVLTLTLDSSRFPLFAQGKTVKIKSVELVADSKTAPLNNIQLVAPASTAPDVLNLTATSIYGKYLSVSKDYSAAKKDPGTWLIKNPVANARLTDSVLNNLVIIVHYEVS